MAENKTPERRLSAVPIDPEGARAAAQRKAYERLALAIRPEYKRVSHEPLRDAQ